MDEYATIVWWLFAVSAVMFVLTPLAVGWLVVRLPQDYFTARRRPPGAWTFAPALRPVVLVAKNVLGAALVLAGLVMLLVPGQGLLTIAAGLVLLDFPGKYRLECWLATRPSVWRAINWMRRRAGREPLEPPAGNCG